MALAATLFDSFNAGYIRNIWSTTLSADATKVVNTNSQIQISHPAGPGYNYLSAAATYDLTGNYFFVEVVSAGDQSLATHEVQVIVYLDGHNKIILTVNTNTLSCNKVVADVQTNVGGIAYNATTHRWWRFRESGGSFFADTSADSVTWTQRFTAANPFALTSITPTLTSGAYGTDASGSFGYFDNFNEKFGRLNNQGLRPYPFSPGMAR